MKTNRLNNVLQAMRKKNLSQMIISSPEAIFYLTGKWLHCGERMVALYISTNGDKKLILNELFPLTEDLSVEVISYKDSEDPIEKLTQIVNSSETLGIDKNWQAHFLIRLMEKNGAKNYINGSMIIDRIRMIKDTDEIELMKKVSKINDESIEKTIKALASDKTEKQMASIIGEIYEEAGTEGFSFHPIVGYGKNAADPHHENDNSYVKEGDCVVIDMGCRKSSYCSDMTRTVFYGEPNEESKKVYETVLKANLAAINVVKPGVRFCDIDKAARDVIEEAGYGEYFTHRTGHSIGIETHDFGDVSSVNTDTVAPGMIFSIEPGIYLPGKVGVRIEDLVLVTEEGCHNLNSYPKDLLVVNPK